MAEERKTWNTLALSALLLALLSCGACLTLAMNARTINQRVSGLEAWTQPTTPGPLPTNKPVVKAKPTQKGVKR